MDKDYFGALHEEYTSPFDTGQLQIVDTFYVKYVKRFFDIIFSFVALVILSPINIVIFVVTLLDVGTPVFFAQERPGLAEKPIKIVKFRNMTNDVDENGKLLPPDQRITKAGHFIRKYSLDELLQFWLIFTGKMSIIGPRPLLMVYLPRYNLRQHERHCVKPGLECPLANYENENVLWEDRLENDVWYVHNISFKTDLIMLIRLIKLVFNKKRSIVRSEKIDNEFIGDGANSKGVA